MSKDKLNTILQFSQVNVQVDPTIINFDQITNIVTSLTSCLESNIEGDVVEFGCFVGESSKYLRKTLDVYESDKKLYVYDSFEGLPGLSEWEQGTGWTPGTLKSTEDILSGNFTNNNLQPPIMHKDWFKDIPEEKLPEKISFAFLDGDFYDSIYDSLSKVYDRVSPGGCILFHDYDRPDLPGVKAAVFKFMQERGVTPNVRVLCDQLGLFVKPGLETSAEITTESHDADMTIVSGLWNINRVGRDWSRYTEHFDKFLKIKAPMVLFVPSELEEFVWERRSKENTFVKIYELEDIKNIMFSPFWDQWQSIRSSEEWKNQAGWLGNSPQYVNEFYNPIVMSKMFFLHDAKIWNHFDTNYFMWLDAGITQTCYENYFYNTDNLKTITKHMDPFLFLSYPYEPEREIHGFDVEAIDRYAGAPVKYVCRGGLFGGHRDYLPSALADYYTLLNRSLSEGLAGTEESVFSIMAHLHPHNYRRYSLAENGLIVKYMQDLEAGTAELENIEHLQKPAFRPIVRDITGVKVSLYFLTFNYPEQLEYTIKSLQMHEGFLTHPVHKYIIDNSTNDEARIQNAEICQKYGFVHLIRNENTGICGGRQFAAEHFEQTDSEYYLFFEDDMTIADPEEGICRNGFRKYVPNLYEKILKIMIKEEFDFLKLSYTEVYMDNNIQVSWYNVPQGIRDRDWPGYNQLPINGLDPYCPRTKFDKIEVLDEVSYITGDIYYANWPHITSKAGNKKMFIDNKWSHPYEQTWMSHIYQETIKGEIKPAILLASPVTHERFKHYKPEERVES